MELLIVYSILVVLVTSIYYIFFYNLQPVSNRNRHTTQ